MVACAIEAAEESSRQGESCEKNVRQGSSLISKTLAEQVRCPWPARCTMSGRDEPANCQVWLFEKELVQGDGLIWFDSRWTKVDS